MTENMTKVIEALRAMPLVERSRTVASSPEYQTFLAAFPVEKIDTLTLEQYCVGKKQKSFSWWLERGLQPVLGRYMPGTSRGHLLYWKGDGSVYKHRHLADLADEEALHYTLAVQKAVAFSAENWRSEKWLDDDEQLYERAGLQDHRVTIASGRKLRLLSAYNPDGVVPITSVDHIRHFLIALGVPAEQLPHRSAAVAMSMRLYDLFEQAKEAVPEITPRFFAKALYAGSTGLNPPKRVEGKGKKAGVFTGEEEVEEEEEEEVADEQEVGSELNVILYGPPGTGKTFATVEEALRVLDPKILQMHPETSDATYGERFSRRQAFKRRFDELQLHGRVSFVTFHQSFSYEDFVEGIRAKPIEGGVAYNVEDGVFKKLCLDAEVTLRKVDPEAFVLGDRPVWKMSLGNTQEDEGHIYEECLAEGYVLLGYGEQIDFSAAKTQEEIRHCFERAGSAQAQLDWAVQVVHRFKNEIQKDDVVVISEGNQRVRAIGVITGAYEHAPRSDEFGFAQRRSVKWLRVYDPSISVSEISSRGLTQKALYRLQPPTLAREKLVSLLMTVNTVNPSMLFSAGQRVGDSDYIVEEVSPQGLLLRKPNGSEVPFAWNMLLELASHVQRKSLSLEDIANKAVFDKLPTSKLEKFIVNGYNNVLWKVVRPIAQSLEVQRPTADEPRVLIIDEINRGNVSRIFGELISLIEPSKRKGAPEQLSVTLPYSKEPFSIPKNVYIIGTMNSADRSLTGLDVALRRRFRFKEVLPNASLLDDLVISEINVGKLLLTMNRRIELLLGRDFCLGHAYFYPLLELGDASLQDLAEVFRYQIMPLLEEYFFDDWERIRWVLNDHRVPDGQGFLKRPATNANDLFGSQVAATLRDNRWEHNLQALETAKSYLNIIGQQGVA